MFEKTETALDSICADIVTFGFLFLCMWYSYSQGGGWWTFFTCSMFLVSLSARMHRARWVKLTSKKEAVEWANSLPDDEPQSRAEKKKA